MLEKGFTPARSGPGALDILSAQPFSSRWLASNDSEAFDDAVATTVHFLYSHLPNDSQFKFRNDATEAGTFCSYRTQRLQHSGARGDLDFSSPVASHTLLVGSVG